MSKSLFITATNTNVGKTHTTLALIKALGERGIRPGVFKPIETGVTTQAPDASALLEASQHYNPNFRSMTTSDITAYTFSLPAAPFCADTEHTIEPHRIIERYQELLEMCDFLLVEGAGGVMVPITQTYLMAHLIKELNTHTLLVTPSRLGCINETLLSMMALRQFDISFEWCVNLYEDQASFATVTQPYYDALFPNWWDVKRGLEGYIERLLAP